MTDYDVIIVGIGPVGAALANILGNYGVKVLAVDRAASIFEAPRAIALDNEALRILQSVGLAAGSFRTIVIPEVLMHSPFLGRFNRIGSAGKIDGHPKLVTFFQPELEQALRSRLATLPSVTVRLGVELTGFTSETTRIVANLITHDGTTHQITTKFLVGADGAASTVRRLLGLDFKGETYAEDWLILDALNVAKPIDHIEFICDPKRPAPHMPAPGNRQRWEFKLRANETRAEMERPEVIRQLLQPWGIGDSYTIERIAVYRFHARVADRFSEGRTFLVGDAAHITPPFAGQGLVAGLRDVGNLAWKLAWAVKHGADLSLLDTYDVERKPHARQMINVARLMGKLIMPANTAFALLSQGLVYFLSLIPRMRRFFADAEIKPPHRFKRGAFISRRPTKVFVRGGLFPQAEVRATDGSDAVMLSDDALGGGLALIGFNTDPVQALDPASVALWRSVGGTFVQFVERGLLPACAECPTFQDLTGTLLHGIGGDGWLAIVRPDQCVLHDGPVASADQLVREAAALLRAAS